MPNLLNTKTLIQTSKHPRCATCKHYNTCNSFKSTSTRHQYTIRNSFTSNSNNIIYLITCTKCKKQYVRYTHTRLKDTINQHTTNIKNDQTMYIYAYIFQTTKSRTQLPYKNKKNFGIKLMSQKDLMLAYVIIM